MKVKKKEPAPLFRAATGSLNVYSFPALDTRTNSEPLEKVQADYLAVRFGLSADRAKLVAELAWWRA